MNRQQSKLSIFGATVVTVAANLLLSVSVYANTTGTEKSEKVALQKNGITVWEVPVKNSNHLGFKAQATVDTGIAKVYATIRDVEEAHKWIPSTKSVSMISENEAKGDALLYYVIDMPFPLTDRDLVIKSKITQTANGDVTIINEGSTDKRKPEQKGYIRVKKYSGKWTLEKLADDKTRVTLSGHADPRGGIPSWVANMFVTKQPYDMLKNMKKQVKKLRYKDAELPNIIKK